MSAESKLDKQERLRQATRSLLIAAVPERRDELIAYWEEIVPLIQIVDDGPAGNAVMQAGAFRHVQFNHRILRLFWIASFALWEGYVAFDHIIKMGETRLDRFNELLVCFNKTLQAPRVDDVILPAGVPAPGELVDHVRGNPARAVGELAIFAVAWSFLHEVRHLLRQREGTASPIDDMQACREEELDCDAFAADFLLSTVSKYATDAKQDTHWVNRKRQTNLYCALFSLTLLAQGQWGESATHPAIQQRVDAMLGRMSVYGFDPLAFAIAAAAFDSLQKALPDAPTPLKSPNVDDELAAVTPEFIETAFE